MRYFIAVDLPEKIKEKLKEIKFEEKTANVVMVSDFHLTLKFLGEIDKTKVEIVKKELSKIRIKPFKLKIDKIGSFPKGKTFFKVIWIGVMPKRKIIDLIKRIDDALVTFFEREKRIKPHITLARVKGVKNVTEFRKIFDLQIEGSFDVVKIKLIKSELTEKGARYEIIGEYQ